MPVMQLSTGGHYFMINFGEGGDELVESPGKDYSVQLSTLVEEKIADDDASDPVTDVFVISHGYKTDKQGAVQSYSNWVNGYVQEFSSTCLSICVTSLSVFMAAWHQPELFMLRVTRGSPVGHPCAPSLVAVSTAKH